MLLVVVLLLEIGFRSEDQDQITVRGQCRLWGEADTMTLRCIWCKYGVLGGSPAVCILSAFLGTCGGCVFRSVGRRRHVVEGCVVQDTYIYKVN